MMSCIQAGDFIQAFVEPGSHIIDVLCEAKVRTEYTQLPIKFSFNGISVMFFPEQKVSEVYRLYMDQMGGDVRSPVNGQ